MVWAWTAAVADIGGIVTHRASIEARCLGVAFDEFGRKSVKQARRRRRSPGSVVARRRCADPIWVCRFGVMSRESGSAVFSITMLKAPATRRPERAMIAAASVSRAAHA